MAGRSSTRWKIIAAAVALRHVSASPEESAQLGKETRGIEGISDTLIPLQREKYNAIIGMF